MENEYECEGVILINRKDLLNILNVGEEKYIIDEIYDQVEIDVEVTMSIGIVKVGGQVILVVMNEDDVMRL